MPSAVSDQGFEREVMGDRCRTGACVRASYISTRATRTTRPTSLTASIRKAGYRFNKHFEASLQLNNKFNREHYLRPPGTDCSAFGDTRNVILTVRFDPGSVVALTFPCCAGRQYGL